MKKIYIFKDYRGFLYSSRKNWKVDIGIDIDVLIKRLKTYGYECEERYFSDFRISDNWKDKIVIYQSSEDRGLFYKGYIEDVLVSLEEAGALLIPSFLAFKCHHNKALQELIRLKYLPESNLYSRIYGSYEDLVRDNKDIEYPCVIKSASGAKGTYVELCRSQDELFRKAKKLSKTFNFFEWSKDYIKQFVRSYHTRVSQNKAKFIVQKFMPNLPGDYKLLVFGDKCVAQQRDNRKNDFRASGAGNFDAEAKIPMAVLELAYMVKDRFGVPFVSCDIGFSEGVAELIEFQFITFGTGAVFRSERYFLKSGNNIQEHEGKLVLEELIADAINSTIQSS